MRIQFDRVLSLTCLFVFILGAPLGARAQVITGVSGTVGHGSSMTIAGSGFGSKAAAAPVVWDNVETGSFNQKWQSVNSLLISNQSRHAHSHYSGTVNFQGNGVDGKDAFFTGPNSILAEQWHVQYWFKLDNNFDWGTAGYNEPGANLANVKLFRMWNPGSTLQNFVLATQGYSGGTLSYLTEHVDDPRGASYFGNTSDWAKGVWHLFQFEFKESTVNANDGIFRWWVDGKLFVDDKDIKTREDSHLKRPYIVGFYNSWRDSDGDRDDFYIDDAYIDNTWARVEIGNNQNYTLCTQREIQIPTAWNTGQIVVTTNLGSLSIANPLYLFVVNSSGQVSSGYQISASGPMPTPTPGDGTAPNPPTNLRLNGL